MHQGQTCLSGEIEGERGGKGEVGGERDFRYRYFFYFQD